MADTSQTNISRGGVNLSEIYDSQISIGEIVGRDKIVNVNIQNIGHRALTAAEKAKAEELELAIGINAFAESLLRLTLSEAEANEGGPYKQLFPYRLSDAGLFFGRDQAIADLRSRLRSPLTVLHAESGAGKTSLLQAGIAPRLIAAGHVPLYLRPYDVDPTLKIKRAFIANLDRKRTPGLAAASLRGFLKQVSEVLGSQTMLFIFLDQFEEFFTKLNDQTRARFIGELAECLDDESLAARVHWVLALRAESFSKLGLFRPAISNPFGNDYNLHPLTREEARQAIAGPAVGRGLSFQNELIDTILNELYQPNRQKENQVAPQIQLVCSALIRALPPEQKTITLDLYKQLGGVQGILGNYLDQVLTRELPVTQRPVARWVLNALTTSDMQRVIKSRRQLATELGRYGITTKTLGTVLAQLVDSRLLFSQETVAGVDDELEYELAHEYLLGEIKFSPAERDRKQAEELLAQGVRNWKNANILLGADALKKIEDQFAEIQPNEAEWELLLHSAAEHTRKLEPWVSRLPSDSRDQLAQRIAPDLKHANRKIRQRNFFILWALRGNLPPSIYPAVYRWYLSRQALALAKWSVIPFILLNIWFISSPASPPWQEITPQNIAVGAGPLIVAASQTDPDLIYISDQTPGGLYRSKNGGLEDSWPQVGQAIPNQPVVHGIAATERIVYVTTSAGVFISQDAGDSWRTPATLLNQVAQAVAVVADNPERVYVSILPNGLFNTSDGGEHWSPIALPQDAQTAPIEAIAAYDHTLIIAFGATIWFSLDEGQSWTKFQAEPTVADPVEGLTAFGGRERFWVALGPGGIYDADIEGQDGDGFWRLSADHPNTRSIHSVAVAGNTAFYASSQETIFCHRIWFWPNLNWLLYHLGQSVPCGKR